MIYVNSETILKIDLFSLLIYGRVIHIWDILFLTITYLFSNERARQYSHLSDGNFIAGLCSHATLIFNCPA